MLTTGAGVPIGDKLNEMTAGHRGPLLVQDVVFTDEMAHFDRERIPERVVHAKGAGRSCSSQEAACGLSLCPNSKIKHLKNSNGLELD